MFVTTFVAAPSLLEWCPDFVSDRSDLRLALVDEGCQQFDTLPITECDDRLHGIHKFLATIWIDRVVAGVRAIGDRVKLNRDRMGYRHREPDHVPVWDDGGFHGLLGVVAVGHLDIGIYLGALPGDDSGDSAQIDRLIVHTSHCGNALGVGELDSMTLAVIKANGF